jgi:hypothetical protein
MSLEPDDSNEVFALLQDHKWDKALKEAKKSPKLVRELYQVGGFYDGQISSQVNALHMAAALGAPPELIQGLSTLHPGGAFQVDKRYGRIPLQIAVMSGAPATTVSALIKLDPKTARQKDSNGRIALHYACKDPMSGESSTRFLIRAYAEGADVSDDSGFLPLHVACRYGSSLLVIRMLIRASPKSMLSKTKKGSTPLSCAKTSKGGLGEEIVGILERAAEESLDRDDRLNFSGDKNSVMSSDAFRSGTSVNS